MLVDSDVRGGAFEFEFVRREVDVEVEAVDIDAMLPLPLNPMLRGVLGGGVG